MSIDNEIKLLNIADKLELESYYDEIAALFYDSFGRPLNRDLWEWAYLKNPFGDPVVSIAIHENRVVGHYAVVPMNLENKDGFIKGFLSMTTMVGVEYRKLGLFKTLAEMVYDRIDNLEIPSIVFGFPNDNSTPGFIRKLDWTISESYKVVKVPAKKIHLLQDCVRKTKNENSYTLSLNDSKILKWRTSKPTQEWDLVDGVGIKKIDEEYDLMHVQSSDSLRHLRVDSCINVILPVDKTQDFMGDLEISFPYRFGYRLFNTNDEIDIFVQMSMSDVF